MTRRSFARDPAVWGVAALALVWRLLYLVDLRHTPFFAQPQMDALYHDQWARRLAAGAWWGGDVFFRAPLYPYFLGALYAVFGPQYLLVRVVQFLIGTVTVLLVMRAAWHRFGRPTALVAGALLAVYGPLIYFEGELLIVVLETPLFFLTAWAAARAFEKPSARRWLVAGVALGAAALARPTVLALPAAFLPAAAVALRRRFWRPAALYLAGIVLVLSPVLVRNWVVGHDVVPVASQGGLNFYLGNHAGADGMAALSERFRATWTGGLEDARAQAEAAEGRALRPSEISRYWYGEAFSWIRAHPGDFLNLLGRKFGYFWDAFEIPNNQDYGFFSRLARLFRWHLVLGFWLVGPLAVAGLALGLRERRLAFAWVATPLVLALVIVAFFVCDRFRVPLAPFFALWAATGVTAAAAAARRRDRGALALYGIVLVAAAVWMNADPWGLRARHTPAESHLRLGIFYASRGAPEKAEAEYKAAVAADPGFADGWNNLGALYAGEGASGEARDAFERAIALRPDHAKALGNLAALDFQEGNRAEADSLARRVTALRDSDTGALYNAAVVLGNLGDPEAARDAFDRIVVREPLNADARVGAARARILLGDPGGARDVLLGFPAERRTPAIRELLERLGGEGGDSR